MPASRTSRYGHVRLRLVLAVVLATAWLSAADAQQPPRLVSAMGINVVSAVGAPNNGQATLSSPVTIAYTPTLNFSGTGVFTYSVTDNVFTTTGTVSVTVITVTDAPIISDVGDITVTTGASTGALPFTVGDVEAGGNLSVTAESSNLGLVPNANLVLGGSGVNRTVTINRSGESGGQATITLTVFDHQGAAASRKFVVVGSDSQYRSPVYGRAGTET